MQGMSSFCAALIRVSAFILLAWFVLVVTGADIKTGKPCNIGTDAGKDEADEFEISDAGALEDRYSMNFKMSLKCVQGSKATVWEVQFCNYVKDGSTIQPWVPGEAQRIDLRKFTFYVKCNRRKVPAIAPGWIGLDCTEEEANAGTIKWQWYWVGNNRIFVKITCTADKDGEKAFRWHAQNCYPKDLADTQTVTPGHKMTLADKSKVMCNELEPPSESEKKPKVDATSPKKTSTILSKVSNEERNLEYMRNGKLI